MARLTQKQENFCLAVIETGNQSAAYRMAYAAEKMTIKQTYEEASKLMANPKIAQRIEELRRPVMQKVQYGLEQAMREAEEAYLVAKQKENGGAMVAAATLRARLNGLLVEKKEIRTGPLEDVSDTTLNAIIASKSKELGLKLH